MNSITDRRAHYCIIGAGPAGLLAARSLRRAGIPYEQFDQNPDVGGIWDIRNAWSPIYESAHFISSKTVSHLPGYPMREDYPDYPNHRQVFEYLQAFARDCDLYRSIAFETTVERVDRDGEHWLVRLGADDVRRYRGLFLCSGNTWDPKLPEYSGEFVGETMHSVRYRRADVFADKRVLIVGAGNSGCDIACDAATHAASATISMRRGYHFIPKYILGQPADVFAGRIDLPRWVERPMFEALLYVLVGDLRNYGLPKPDHRVLESHPIVNTQILHYLGHGDLSYKPDIERLDGHTVHFVDGSSAEFDMIVYATGYKVTYPYMDKEHFRWLDKYPDLYLSGIHRNYDNLCCLGLHQTDGGAYDFFAMQADMMANFILDQTRDPNRAARFSRQKARDYPDLSGGIRYVKSARHATYVKKSAFRKFCLKMFRDYRWRQFSTEPS